MHTQLSISGLKEKLDKQNQMKPAREKTVPGLGHTRCIDEDS